ncbi:hypothetical protein N7532_004069 [Penicillium argentinense]|uniref:Hemerythrin-like domain-containing protein n=1 Tax=Penicillium argentinense TaxID=1131581 RepID=A0A9W9FNP1_9EURO|nr:uncharacterized protein N7532_004069 [Penicillium argentinense]KAJ5103540.1 hypothetical protein N7532_004069 [Penicillium argentinense]
MTASQRASDTTYTAAFGSSDYPFLRSISPPLRTFSDAAATPTSHVRILAAIKHEHRELESHSRKIINSTSPDEQTRYQNQFTWELARHTIGEELVAYPTLAEYVKNGQALADKNRAEHQDLKEQLKMFQGLRSTDPRFVPTLQALMGDLENHIRTEEADFARLEAVLSQEDSEALTHAFDRTKMFVPSRSHPLAPNKPPFETAVGLLTAPVDMVADMFRKWPHPVEEGKHKMSVFK